MPHIHPDVAEDDLSRFLQQYLKRIYQGKVRDTYEIPGHPDLLLIVATDRISIFDYVLNARVQGKGINLTKRTVHWLTKCLKGINHHLVAHGKEIFRFLPQDLGLAHLKDQPPFDLEDRAMIVMKLEMVMLECIARGYITGSGYKDYLATGEVCGIRLPAGLNDSDRLPEHMFTPSTKETKGHDQNISEEEAAKIVGWPMLRALKRLTLSIYGQGHAYGLTRGMVVADTKLEFGLDQTGRLRLGDEVLTPDSSRYWPNHDWCVSPIQGKAPAGFDKQSVRDAGKHAVLPDGTVIDISSKEFKNTEDPVNYERVWSWKVPQEVLDDCSYRYNALEKILRQPV